MQKTAGLSAFPNICFASHQRIPAGIAVLIMVAILLTAPGASAGTLSGPSSTSANSFTLTWSVSPPAPPPFAWDSGTHAATLEENGNSISPGSGSVTLSRPSGTYNYRIEKCSWYYYYGYTTTCDSATKTVTVSNQPAVPPSATAFSNSCTSTAMHWGAVTSNVSQYRVYEQVNGGSWSQVYAGSRKTASSPLILNRSAQTTYRYRVRADYSAAGYSAVSGYRYSSSIVTPICDADADGIADSVDQCPNTPVGETANASGCSPSQLDSDGDGVTDAADQCPATPVGVSVDTDGCAASQLIPTVEQPPAPDLSMPSVSVSAIDQTLSLGGQFNVSPGGQATYEIPIEAPRGSGGLAPNISLRYNSGVGNGMAGWGWSISGLGSISRCRQTEGHDKNAAPITWSAEDRFCLNGERLLVTSGTYGAPGSTYRTEIDSYARITAVGGTTGHPDYFKVERKDGRVDYYGSDAQGTTSSDIAKHRVNPTNPKTYSWLLSRQEDSTNHMDGQGNQITYQYTNAEGSGALPRISAIVYNGGRLYFDWELRQDKTQGYIAGYEYSNEYRLKKIESRHFEEEIRSYTLSYGEEADPASDRISRLTSIEHCVAGGGCGRANAFEWSLPALFGIDVSAVSGSTMPLSNIVQNHVFADINGDGLGDLVWATEKIHHAIASVDSQGRVQFTDKELVNGDIPALRVDLKIFPLDYNADGRQDIAVWQPELGTTQPTKIFLSMPQADGSWAISASSSISLPSIGNNNDNYLFVDVNGNGLQDIIRSRSYDPATGWSDKVRMHMSNQLGAYHPEQDILYTYPGSLMACSNGSGERLLPETGDFNGDGRMDFVGPRSFCDSQGTFLMSRYVLYTSHPTGTGGLELRYFDTLADFNVDYENGEPTLNIDIADFNQDGLSDVIFGGGSAIFRLSTGSALGQASDPMPLAVSDLGVKWTQSSFVDMNGDGHPDFVDTNIFENTTRVRHWDPMINDFSTIAYIKNIPELGIFELIRYVDVNGDSYPDLVAFDSDHTHEINGVHYNLLVYPHIANELYHDFDWQPGNKITTIYENADIVSRVRYEHLGQSNHYSYIEGVNSQTSEQVCESTVAGNVCWSRQVAESSSTKFYDSVYDPFGSGSGNQYSYNQSLENPLVHRVFNVNGSMPVVTEVSQSIPVAGPANPGNVSESVIPVSRYYYEQARMQASGRGYLGFRKVIELDLRSSVRSETIYRQDWPFNGRPLWVRQFIGSGYYGDLLDIRNTWGFADCYNAQGYPSSSCVADKQSIMASQGISALGPVQPFLARSIEVRWTPETIDDIVSTVDKVFVQDDKGNTVYEDKEIWNGDYDSMAVKKTTSNQYSYSGTGWSMQQGRLTQMTVTHADDSGNSITRQSSFSYYTSGRVIGLVETETLEPNNSDYTQTTTHYYDDFGNRTQSIVTGGGETRYGPRLEYDAAGRYVDRIYERFNNGADGSVERLVSDVIAWDNYGNPTETRRYIDANNYITEWASTTSMGVPYRHYDSTGAWTVTGAGTGTDPGGFCSQSGLSTYTHQHIYTAGGGERVVCFDQRGRTIREATKLLQGWSLVDTEYDALDRIVRVSVPYSDAVFRYWTEYKNYDALNRVKRIEHSDYAVTGAVTTYQYYKDHTVTTNPLTHVHREYKNALGQITRTIDPMGGNTWFTYDARGNLKTLLDPVNNITTIDYDLLDRKISMDDPDKGLWTYQYNHMDELACQRDAKGQVIKHSYDFKGRLINRKDYTSGTCESPDGTLESDSVWTYDTSAYGLGQLDSVTDSISGYEKQVTYEHMGRPSITRTRIPGVGNQLEDHYEKVTYDQHGRMFQVFDAARPNNTFNHNGVQYVYKDGYLHKLVDATYVNGQPLTTYYQVETVDRRGNITEATYGNGVMNFADYDLRTGRITDIWATNGSSPLVQNLDLKWDVAGNLLSRHERGADVNGSPRDLREDFTEYDALNRLRKHQLSGDASGIYTIGYDAIGNIDSRYNSNEPYSWDYYYEGCGGGPHAVCEVNDSWNIYKVYQYDANGNQTSGDGRAIEYSIFDKPTTITKGSHRTRFRYSPDRARYQRTDETLGLGQLTTTLYLGSVEKVYYYDGSIRWKRYIGGIALIIQDVDSAGNILQERQTYFHKNHLGNINVITDDDGEVIETLDYDPWGRRRNTQNWEAMLEQYKLDHYGIFASPKPETSRGFTGHEHLDEVGLIHMNGRIYDDFLGRFVQADPIIQDPYRSQSLNRYSYVWNNPLNATDPSGFVRETYTPDQDLDERSWSDGHYDDPWDDRDDDPWTLLQEAFNDAERDKVSANSLRDGIFSSTLTHSDGTTVSAAVKYTNGHITAVAIETDGGWKWYEATKFDTRYADNFGSGLYDHDQMQLPLYEEPTPPMPEEGIVSQLSGTLGLQLRGSLKIYAVGFSFAADRASIVKNFTTGELVAREEYFFRTNVFSIDFTMGKTRSATIRLRDNIFETLNKVPFRKIEFMSGPNAEFQFGGAFFGGIEYIYDAKQHVENLAIKHARE